MAVKTVNGIPLEEILRPYEDDPEGVQRMPGRSERVVELSIVEPDPRWADDFQTLRSRILAAFETTPVGSDGERVSILAINHIGSTSVPDLPAKAVIDIDLVLTSNGLSAEPFYVPRLEAAGFEFRHRERWREHRFFHSWEPISCSLHVWGPQNPEVERHLIFRDWVRTHEDDRNLYAKVKRECAEISHKGGENVNEYVQRKDWVIREIFARAFKDLGYID